GATSQSLLGVETARYYIHFLDGLKSRNVRDNVRLLHGRRTDAVDACVVLVVTGSVDVKLERTRRVRRDGVRVEGGRKARKCPVNLLVVAANRHRKVLEFH